MVDEDDGSGFTGNARGRKARTRSQTTLGIDPARAFNISVRMDTCILTVAGTKGKETGFTFPIVMDNSSTFEQFRATTFAKYPWGLHDVVELRYSDVPKVAWVPVQSDNGLGVMFANNAKTMSCNMEISVIQRHRSQNNSNPTGSRPFGSKASKKARTNARATSSSCRPPTTPSANAQSKHSCCKIKAKPSIPVDPVVEEAEHDAALLFDEEDEKLYPGYAHHNNEEVDMVLVEAARADLERLESMAFDNVSAEAGGAARTDEPSQGAAGAGSPHAHG
ncbi:hypothetical protein ZWY2020_057072 [Hordeum vulgare]|nr:hypothetical protein ZWY2020_057072 [Hordeum vulgare]